MSGKIKAKSAFKSKHNISPTNAINYDDLPIIFSLERVQSGYYCFSSLDQEHKAQFSESIFKRKSLLWSDIKNLPRHGLGTEKITRKAINPPIPAFVKDDLSDFLVFRFHGKKPMIGYRVRNVFYVLWFDHNFSVYKH